MTISKVVKGKSTHPDAGSGYYLAAVIFEEYGSPIAYVEQYIDEDGEEGPPYVNFQGNYSMTNLKEILELIEEAF